MNSEFPRVDTAMATASSSRSSATRKPAVAIIAVAFLGGIVATLWATPRIQSWWQGTNAEQSVVTDNQALLANDIEEATTDARSDQASLNVASLEARLAAVSAKLDSISEQAAGAGGNAARAEGLLVAFAVRRALDRGAPLGYLEGELRLRFGDAQPRAVATIINAASAPITLADLQQSLDDVAPKLLGTEAKSDWWTATKRELANLVIIRKAGEPSPTPQKALERARLLIASGRVDAALKEIERLPDHQDADDWLQMARQYNEARRALDVVEAAAILEPRSVPVTPRAGGPTNMQVAPPPPTVEPEAATP